MKKKEKATNSIKDSNVLASEIMTKNPYVVQSSMTINEVSEFFLEHNFTSAPVLGSDGDILGILDEFTLIKIKVGQHMGESKKDKLAFYTEMFQPIFMVVETEPLIEVMKQMIKAPNHRLFVMNSFKTLVGIISPKDVLRYVVGARKKSVDIKAELESTKNSLNKTLFELQKTKNRLEIYQDIVMENPTMIHSVDAKGKIIMANRKMHEILGYSPGELIGKTIYDIYADNVHDKALEGLKTIIAKGSHKNTYTTMVKKTGEKFRVDVASAAINDDKDKFIGTISVSRPVDSDVLLRALHGVMSSADIPTDRYESIKDILGDDVIKGAGKKNKAS